MGNIQVILKVVVCWQGGSLSHLLLIVVLGLLTKFIGKAMEGCFIKGVKWKGWVKAEWCLLFDYDTLFFFARIQKRSLHPFKGMLLCFELESGLEENITKVRSFQLVNTTGLSN